MIKQIFLSIRNQNQKSFPHGLQQRYHSPGDASAHGDAKLQRPSVVVFVPDMAGLTWPGTRPQIDHNQILRKLKFIGEMLPNQWQFAHHCPTRMPQPHK